MNAILSVAAANYGGSALSQWQLLFVLVGVVTIFMSFLLYFFLPDRPTTAWWLSDREKIIAVKRLAENRTGVENKQLKWSQVKVNLSITTCTARITDPLVPGSIS